jgi:hypothetical protein
MHTLKDDTLWQDPDEYWNWIYSMRLRDADGKLVEVVECRDEVDRFLQKQPDQVFVLEPKSDTPLQRAMSARDPDFANLPDGVLICGKVMYSSEEQRVKNC